MVNLKKILTMSFNILSINWPSSVFYISFNYFKNLQFVLGIYQISVGFQFKNFWAQSCFKIIFSKNKFAFDSEENIDLWIERFKKAKKRNLLKVKTCNFLNLLNSDLWSHLKKFYLLIFILIFWALFVFK